jgi:hypothetical protein
MKDLMVRGTEHGEIRDGMSAAVGLFFEVMNMEPTLLLASCAIGMRVSTLGTVLT